jgi:hypothetical protein
LQWSEKIIGLNELKNIMMNEIKRSVDKIEMIKWNERWIINNDIE